MQEPQDNPRPGFFIIEKYMPDATAEAKEEAYQNLRDLVAVLVRINARLARERAIHDSAESDSYARVDESDDSV